MNESSQSSRLPPLMSDEMAQLYIREQTNIIREEVRKELEAEKVPLNQKELMEKFGFDAKYLKKLLANGLKRRKQGRDWKYALADVYEVLDYLKENFRGYQPRR